MRYLLFLTAGALSIPAGAATTGDALKLIEPAPPKTVRAGETLAFRTVTGYHFNEEAPQECGALPAFDVGRKSLKCRFPSPGRQDVSLKICADGGDTCFFADFTLDVSGPAVRTEEPKRTAGEEKEEALEGFLLNVPLESQTKARDEHKLLFIDFFAKWCPPCRLMESTVLDKPKFMEATAGMVRISLDVDKPEASEWVKRFSVNAYPTYLVADASLNEIGRWTGSAGLPAFTAWLKDQERWKELPIAKAEETAASLDDAGKLRVAKARMDAKKWQGAMELLSELKTREAEFLHAYAGVARAVEEAPSSTAAALAPVYTSAISRFDGSDGKDAEVGIMEWVGSLHRIDPKAAALWLDDADTLAGRFLASRSAEAEGYTPADIYVTVADALEEVGMKEKAGPFYFLASESCRELAEAAAAPAGAKGLRLCEGRYLAASGRYGEAAEVYAALVKAYPGEYAFHRAYAGALLKLKKYPEALLEAREAERLSYGNIRYSIIGLEARIEAEHGRKDSAVKILKEGIAAAEKAGDGAGGLKRYLEEVEKGK
ncbi:MAG: thioredoxin domain-containing protein [Elusimicrobia bacterium]|nr:thioredoxin domain-containing protein [Elusimicrobiota bacterium]